jgi:methionyl-tRNA formyltransferase
MPFSLGPVNKLLLIGGGQVLLDVAAVGRRLGLEVFVLTSSRHLTSFASGDLGLSLDQLGVTWKCSDNLEDGIIGLREDFSAETIPLSLSNPWIVSEGELERIFSNKLMNCHGTRLPLDRGAGGFSWRILSGNRLGIVNLYQMTPAVDGGPILDFEEFVYPGGCRIPIDFERFYFTKLVCFLESRFQEMMGGGWLARELSQADYLSTYWPRLSSTENGWINWSYSTSEIYRFVCAFDSPYSGARTTWNGEQVVLRDCLENYSDGNFHPYQAGIVYRKSEGWVCISTSDGNLIVSNVENLQGESILQKIKVGDRFVTEGHSLDSGRSRKFLDPTGWRP